MRRNPSLDPASGGMLTATSLRTTRPLSSGPRSAVARVLREVLAGGCASRVEIAQASQLSSAAVTRITRSLITEGILHELPRQSRGQAGAPRVPLVVNRQRYVAFGVHVGQRRLNVGVVDLSGQVIDRCEVLHDTTDAEVTLREARKACERLAGRRRPQYNVVGTGFSVGGLVDAETGTVVENAGLGWKNVPFTSLAEASFAHPVSVDSTYRGLARAQACFRYAPEASDFVLLFIGNLIGAALVIDGRIHPGHHHRAGNIAHLPVSIHGEVCPECGRDNCFLTVAGDQAVAHQAADEGLLPRDATDQQLMDLIADADPRAELVFLARARAVGEVIATLTNVLDPDQVLLADPIMEVSPRYTQVLREAAGFGEDSAGKKRLIGVSSDAVVAAATGVLDRFYDDPLANW